MKLANLRLEMLVYAMEGYMVLEKELETYQNRLAELSRNKGKWVLISGSEVIGLYPKYEDALKEGYKRYGTAPFLAKKVEDEGASHFMSRDLCPI